MLVVVQRVSEASVSIRGETKGAIRTGWLVLIGIEVIDTADDLEWLSGKLVRLRLFDDEQGVNQITNRDSQPVMRGRANRSPGHSQRCRQP